MKFNSVGMFWHFFLYLCNSKIAECDYSTCVFIKCKCWTLWRTVGIVLFQSDGDVPLLGEMVSPGPKGVLIKEAKVKKPSTVPLVKPAASRKVWVFWWILPYCLTPRYRFSFPLDNYSAGQEILIIYKSIFFFPPHTWCSCEVLRMILLCYLNGAIHLVCSRDTSVHVSTCTSYNFSALAPVISKLWCW